MTSANFRKGLFTHFKCRSVEYPSKNNGHSVLRVPVPDDKVSWEVEWPDYVPHYFTSPIVIGKSWADQEIDSSDFHPQWNSLDGNVNRRSYHGTYEVVNNLPMNPVGRTGMSGRGILGRWGPNHAADPIVTMWKRDENGFIVHDKNTTKPIMQFIGIKRKDCGEWAIPGGMVDPGEVISQTLRREFFEEALNYLEMNETGKNNMIALLNDFFKKGVEVYKGYVDDVRNTDNAWIETVAHHFHDEVGTLLGKLSLSAGDDAKDVMWIDISQNVNLYASHSLFIKLVVKNHNGHW